MPELPDVTVYIEALRERVLGQPLTSFSLLSPFILRTVEPPLDAAIGRAVLGVERLGKRIVFEFEPERSKVEESAPGVLPSEVEESVPRVIPSEVEESAHRVIPSEVEESALGVIPSAVEESAPRVIPSEVEESALGVIPSEVEESALGVIPSEVEESARPLFIVIHLMIAGRFRWFDAGTRVKIPGKLGLAEFDFPTGKLVLTEAGSKRRASLHVLQGRESLKQFDRGGLEVLDASLADFTERLKRENHTLKRSLTDPRLFSGIGNAYSDELLHRARLSPLKLTSKLSDEEITRLFDATKATLIDWTDRLRQQYANGFPEKVTAFRDDMAVHGRYQQPCPVCSTPVQRIRYTDNETNYCPRCQTEGRLLADRALSRLLKQDWPKTVEDLEG